MRHQNSIKGVTFKNNPNTVEHQWFPVEYFSGSDVTVYFGDTFLSECSGLQFGIEERVQPIHGYASYAWDCVARGTRIVTGSFEIPFTEAGYLDAILMHIGQYTSDTEKVKPKMAYKLSGQKVPNWCADYKMDVEGLFNKFDKSDGGKGNKTTKTVTPGTVSAGAKALNEQLVKSVGYIETPLSQFIRKQYGRLNANTCTLLESEIKTDESIKKKFTTALQETINIIFKADEKKRFENRQVQYIKDGQTITRKLTELNADGIYDSVTSDALSVVLNWFGYNTSRRTRAMESSLYEYGDVVEITGDMIKLLLGFTSDNKYDVQTFLQVTNLQTARGYVANGNAKIDLPTNDAIGDKIDKPKPSFGKDGSLTRWEDRTARYESEIWGRDFTADTDRKFQSFFYTDRYRNAGLNGEKMLKKYGFDIYITYGPAAEAQKYNTYWHEQGTEAPALDTYSFQTTVKAIRNVQITSSYQRIDPNGNPISEVYNFIARDLD